MYKDLKIKINKFIIKAKQHYRNKELQLLRRNHQRSTNELHNKLESYKPLATLYEINDIEEITTNDLKKKQDKMHSTDEKTDNKRKNLDKYKKNSKIQRIFTNALGTTIVCDLIGADLTF